MVIQNRAIGNPYRTALGPNEPLRQPVGPAKPAR